MRLSRSRWSLALAALLAAVIVVVVAERIDQPSPGPAGGTQVVRPAPATEPLVNPERGFFLQQEHLPGPIPDVRAQGWSVVRGIFRLDDHAGDDALPQAYLDAVGATFEAARARGVKLIVRFAYNYSDGGADASLSRILAHVRQLGPVLAANQDTVLAVDAGFIGAWGEWHSSTHGLDEPGAERQVLEAELAAFPPAVKIGLRYPRDKRALLGNEPLRADEAGTTQPRARVGFTNDCFLADHNDAGTFQTWEADLGEEERAFVAADTAYVPMTGETCVRDDRVQPRFSGCEPAQRTLAAQHWTALSGEFYRGVLDLWRGQGCSGTIGDRLGYRLLVTEARVPRHVAVAAPLRIDLQVRNDGYAAPVNRRPVEVVLRDRASGRIAARLETTADPRQWLPGPPQAVALRVTLPRTLPAGRYDVLLGLPDPSPRLRDRPDYAIRLAHRDGWEPATGLNDLGATLAVGDGAT